VAKTKSSTGKVTGAKVKTVAASRGESLPMDDTDFEGAFSGLKNVMSTFAAELKVTADEPRKYYLVTKSKSWKGGPMFFGAVMSGKAYVSYHLMPLYCRPELAKEISPALKKRMQGKSCFNFRRPDQALFAELASLTGDGLEFYRAKNWL
jgi:hypothetical protein